jgi:hypothetical protein
MADDVDPPRKFYGFKPREFDPVNKPVSSPENPPPLPSPPALLSPIASAENPASPRVDLRDIIRDAQTSGPVLGRSERAADNDVHAILRDNLARANAAGLNELAPKPRRPSRRKRDYWLLIGTVDPLLVFFAISALRSGNAVLFVYSMAGIGFFTAAVTWVMWFVMDDY